MRQFIFVILLLMGSLVRSQNINVDDPRTVSSVQVFLQTIQGVPYSPTKYYRIKEGSIFIPENFTHSVIYFANQKKYFSKVLSRINIIENQLHYLNDKGDELITNTSVEEIYFIDSATQQTTVLVYQLPNCKNPKRHWYEVLEKGKVSLYREIDKYVSETKVYGSATLEATVQTTYYYWLVSGNSCKMMRSIDELINELDALNPGFKPQISKTRLSNKKVEDWTSIVRSFNGF